MIKIYLCIIIYVLMNTKSNTFLAIVLIIIGSCARLIPHLPNFTPTETIAIFGAAYLGRTWLPYFIPVVTMYFADFIINNTVARSFFPNHDGLVLWSNYMLFNIIAIMLIVLIAQKVLNKINFKNVMIAAIVSSVVFYLITNFGSWVSLTSIYSKDFTGLMSSYVAGLPFLRTTLISNLLFSGVIFGSMHFLISMLKTKTQHV